MSYLEDGRSFGRLSERLSNSQKIDDKLVAHAISEMNDPGAYRVVYFPQGGPQERVIAGFAVGLHRFPGRIIYAETGLEEGIESELKNKLQQIRGTSYDKKYVDFALPTLHNLGLNVISAARLSIDEHEERRLEIVYPSAFVSLTGSDAKAFSLSLNFMKFIINAPSA